MFDLGIINFAAFVVASIMLNLVPGPDTFYVLGRSMAQGRGVGMASTLGISAGAFCHTLLAAVGLSALITASPTAFMLVKWLGAAYLVFLGAKMLLSRAALKDTTKASSEQGFVFVVKQGLLTNLLNPKVALFFLAFLPQFITAQASSHFVSFMVLGLTFVATSTLWGFFLAYSSAALSRKLRENPKSLVLVNRLTGTLLVGLGIKLATDR
ncbi:MAG: LysE family translocator [Pontibacterium sp.]